MFDVLVCGNRESCCPTAAENGPAEVIKTSAKQTRSSAEPHKRDQTLLRADVKETAANDCWSACSRNCTLEERFLWFLHCTGNCLCDEMLCLVLLLKRRRKKDQKHQKNIMFMRF